MRSYLVVSGSVFGLIGLLHLLRILLGWHATVADYSVPTWFSIIAVGVFFYLAGWAVRLGKESRS